jgi:hypothetical protein
MELVGSNDRKAPNKAALEFGLRETRKVYLSLSVVSQVIFVIALNPPRACYPRAKAKTLTMSNFG